METANTNPAQPHRTHSCDKNGRVWTGVLIVAVGVVLLVRKLGVDVPDWLFSFEMIIILVGLYIGIRHNFRGLGWVVPIAIGLILLADDFYPQLSLGELTWPLIIIGVGLVILLRPGKKKHHDHPWENRKSIESNEDLLDSVAIFGGIKKQIISKDFRGGEAVTIFGGTELNLAQAEINHPVELELTQVFGGTKLIVPAHWKVRTNDLVAIFGGIDDKRPPVAPTSPDEEEKILTLKGTCVLGGIEIRSY